MKIKFLSFLGLLLSFQLYAQTTFPLNDVQDKRVGYHLFKNAIIHVNAEVTIPEGWLLIKDDKIENIGKDFDLPKGTIVHDLKGKHIYPSFIEPYSSYGMPKTERARGGNFYQAVLESSKKGAYAWNEALKPENSAVQLFVKDSKTAEALRKEGFGLVVTHVNDGIVRGNSSLVSLGEQIENQLIIKEKVSANYSLNKGTSKQSYPVSLMGCVALLRQTFYDAEWYKKGGNQKEKNTSLAQFTENLALKQVFEARDAHEVLRIDKIGKEFSTNYIVKTNGDEYQFLNEIKSSGLKLIVPLNYPETKDVEDPYDAKLVSLKELKHWEMAPANLAKLSSKGIDFVITGEGLKSPADYLKNIRKAITFGLDKTVALKAMTSNVATILGLENVGELKKGYLANFIISSADIFDENAIIYENWIQGNSFSIKDANVTDIRGNYNLTIGNERYKLLISGDLETPKYEITFADSIKIETKVTRNADIFTFNLKSEKGVDRLSGYYIPNKFQGKGIDAKAVEVNWLAEKIGGDSTKVADKKKTVETKTVGEILYPFTAFGNKELPKATDLLIKNATVWTNEKEGIVNTDVFVSNGKIAKIGKNLSISGAKTIDGTGKHLTSGIIDEHTHIALFSINEVESVSSEVRQEDVIDAEDIDIYRQLAGGVTAGQLLHGSADCIGGQSALIKYKWGESPENLKIKNADGFIKFALGENVKRGNAPQASNRYPSTRMGVEQVMQDAFQRAKEYKAEWMAYNSLKSKTGITPPRKNLELEALVEILDNKRFITCHSYVQSEINMLLKLAEEMGFKVNTLTHILEGYKVADKMKSHGASASTFSDWWAYKMEVKEAIPYNAAIMTKMGITTAINSDDAEMARRLNQEAAKTILYGGLSEEEAWKTVTLNPAKMLHLDNRMGSIKEGKDADLVLWTENPLSVYSHPTYTIIDGAIYFDAEQDKIKQREVAEEKNRIIQKMIEAKKGGTPTVKPERKTKPSLHCDSIVEFGGESIEHLEFLHD